MKNKKVRRSSAEWESLVNRQAGSGQTIKGFCELHGLAHGTFLYWRHKLKNKPASPNGFIALVPQRSTRSLGASNSRLLLRGRGGVEVEAPCDISPDTLRVLITALSC